MTDEPGAAGACPHGHAGLAAELRALAVLALDRVDPLLDRLPAPGGAAPTCTGCPVCAALTAVRAERPELAGRLARHATGLVAAVREVLQEPASAPAPPARPVQRIPVDRDGSGSAADRGAPC